MTLPEHSQPEYDKSSPDVRAFAIYPGFPTDLDKVGNYFTPTRTAAVVLVGYACGTTPENLNPFINRVVKGGVPVFIVSGEGAGGSIPKLTYETQVAAVEAGATPLRDADSTRMVEVVEHIRGIFHRGLRGQVLVDLVIAEYGSSES
jgi:L-asparaginase/Glu-tRNA(Gln) amidotransferase subunit D